MNFIYVLFPKIPVPTIFAWDVEGPTVYVSGDWDGWRGTIPLCPSELDFSGLIPLYPGEYIYKFSVDGKWKYATITKIEKNFQGTFNNSSAITRLWEFLYPDDSLLEKIIFQDTFFSDFESQNLKRYNRKTSTMPPHYIAFFSNDECFFPNQAFVVNKHILFENSRHNFQKSPLIPISYSEFLEHISKIKSNFRRQSNHIVDSTLSLHGYWHHIFFLSLKNFFWKIFQKLPSFWTKNREKTETKIFCSALIFYFRFLDKTEKSINSITFFFINKPLEKKFNFERLRTKEKIINWGFNRFFFFFTKCFF